MSYHLRCVKNGKHSFRFMSAVHGSDSVEIFQCNNCTAVRVRQYIDEKVGDEYHRIAKDTEIDHVTRENAMYIAKHEYVYNSYTGREQYKNPLPSLVD